MRKLFKNRKGMSLIEVIIALAVLSIVTYPIMMAFMNTQIAAKRVDKQTRINAITRTVKEFVYDNVVDEAGSEMIIDINNTAVDMDGVSGTDTFFSFVSWAIKQTSLASTPQLPIFEMSVKNDKYTYTIASGQSYQDTNFPDVYNVLISIIEKDSGNVVNQIKVAINIK